MSNRKLIQLLLLLCLLSINLFAIDGKTRVFIKSKDMIYTSQKVTVSVELLTDAFSIMDAKITFPVSDKYIIQAPQSASYLGKDEIDGNDWQVVHYEYEVYALKAGQVVIPSVSVSFSASMGYGQPKKEFTLKSDALHFTVKVPTGVNSKQFILVTDNYTLTSERKPKKKQLIIGDAVELSITQKANQVPDILLRPVLYTSNALLRVYNKEPELKSGLKGNYDVSRTDKFTFVASGEGNVTIPALEILWWNSATQKIQIETIPDIFFEILPDPQIAIDAKKAQQKERMLYAVGILLLFIILYILFATKVQNYLYERKRVYALSEEGRFKTLIKSCREEDMGRIYAHFYYWLDIASPQLSRDGFRGIIEVQPSFSKALYTFEEILTGQEQIFDKTNFIHELEKFRRYLLGAQGRRKESLPEHINPTMS